MPQQISILNGIYADTGADFRTSYPVNLMPIVSDTGISTGYLRSFDGIKYFGSNSLYGTDRGGINWNGECYRVIGTNLVKIDSSGTVVVLGTVAEGSKCSFDYSFDRLAINAGSNLYYYKSNVLTQVTDIDLGVVNDMLWVDGYFMTTDGSYLVVTDLADPYAVNPLKYGSSELDPDPIIGLLKVRKEVIALNRYTTEFFQNIGGSLFPFQRIEGASIQKGVVGKNAKCLADQSFAFVGSGRNEPVSVYFGSSSSALKVATREVETILKKYTNTELASIILEYREDAECKHLLMHCPDRTMVYDVNATSKLGQPIWFVLKSGTGEFSQYRARNFVYCHNKWIVGDVVDSRIGTLDNTIMSQYDDAVEWWFDTPILFNGTNGAILHSVELTSFTGRTPAGSNSLLSLSYTKDGINYSDEKFKNLGKTGDYKKNIIWYSVCAFRNWLSLHFRGVSKSVVAYARLDAEIEGLNA